MKKPKPTPIYPPKLAITNLFDVAKWIAIKKPQTLRLTVEQHKQLEHLLPDTIGSSSRLTTFHGLFITHHLHEI